MRGDRHTYVPAFDGLRGIAILPVVLLHVGVQTLPSGKLLFELTRGWYGVDLFFVLSGFLITWVLIAEIEAHGTLDLKRFYGRRFLRLGPAYLTMLTTVLVGAMIFHPSSLNKVPRVLPSLLTYTYNYQIAAGGAHFNVIVVIWSLCIEEQFYLVWPWILRKLGTRRALWFCLSAIAILTIYRTTLYASLNWGHLSEPTPFSSIWIYFASGTRIGTIFIGCAAALSLRNPRVRAIWKWMQEAPLFPAAALAAVAACVFFVTGGHPSSASWRSGTFGYTLVACATASLISAVFIQPGSIVSRAFSLAPLVWLGRISYGVYLFHTPVAWLLLRFTPEVSRPGFTAEFAIISVATLLFTCAVAGLHYHYIERWFMSLRRNVAGRADLPGRERTEEDSPRQTSNERVEA